DTGVIAKTVGAESVTKATAQQVRAATGQAIGGVAPTGHPAPLRTLIDPGLGAHDTIWAAGGTPNTIVPLTFQQLVTVTAGHVTPVRCAWSRCAWRWPLTCRPSTSAGPPPATSTRVTWRSRRPAGRPSTWRGTATSRSARRWSSGTVRWARELARA